MRNSSFGVVVMWSAQILYIVFSALVSLFGFGSEEFVWPNEHLVAAAPAQETAGAEQSDGFAQQAAEIATRIDAILQDSRLVGALAGVSVRHADSGELLYSHLGDIRLHPASNMKILTSVAALELLGADYQFSTEVWTDGELENGILHGNIYLKGKGDPTLMKKDLDAFAEQLKAMGIEHVEGHLIGDDSWYDDIRLSRDLTWTDEAYYYGAQVSALSLSPNADYDAGTVIVEVRPAETEGRPAQVQLVPETDYMTIVNNTETVSRKGRNTLKIEREHGSNRIIVEGTIPMGHSTRQSWVTVWEPSGYAVDVFRKSLIDAGVTFAPVSEQLLGETPADATLLTSRASPPLESLLIPFMKLSNNGHGEILTKEMGKLLHGEGSWEQGLAAIAETIAQFGVDTDTIQLRDGSGMSHLTMIPADQLSLLLYAIQDRDWYPIFEDSLPLAGAPERLVGGTLRFRMMGTPAQFNVRAKTGSLTGVSTLSGYVTTRDGEKLIFSILLNNYLASVRSIEDAIASVLAELTWHS